MNKDTLEFFELTVKVLDKLNQRLESIESSRSRENADLYDSMAGFVFNDNSELEKLSNLVETIEISDSTLTKDQQVKLAEFKRKIMNRPESTAAYWNGDSWGGIDGMRDAEAWIDRQVRDYKKKLLAGEA